MAETSALWQRKWGAGLTPSWGGGGGHFKAELELKVTKQTFRKTEEFPSFVENIILKKQNRILFSPVHFVPPSAFTGTPQKDEAGQESRSWCPSFSAPAEFGGAGGRWGQGGGVEGDPDPHAQLR